MLFEVYYCALPFDNLTCEQALLFGLRRSLERSREIRFTRPNGRACSQAIDNLTSLAVTRAFGSIRWLNSAFLVGKRL